MIDKKIKKQCILLRRTYPTIYSDMLVSHMCMIVFFIFIKTWTQNKSYLLTIYDCIDCIKTLFLLFQDTLIYLSHQFTVLLLDRQRHLIIKMFFNIISIYHYLEFYQFFQWSVASVKFLEFLSLLSFFIYLPSSSCLLYRTSFWL